jgi:hypothetical protein
VNGRTQYTAELSGAAVLLVHAAASFQAHAGVTGPAESGKAETDAADATPGAANAAIARAATGKQTRASKVDLNLCSFR